MKKLTPYWPALILALLCCGLSSCTKVNKGVGSMMGFDTNLKVIFVIGDTLNPDENHTPSPLFVRFYELSSQNAFQHADFLELYESDESVLGKDLIAKQELGRIVPSGDREQDFVVDADTKYVALFAEFFQYKNAKYKLVFPVTSHNVIENTVWIEINDNKMLLRKAK